MLTPERERELAEEVALAIANSSGRRAISGIRESTVWFRIGNRDDFRDMSLHQQMDACKGIAALARRAVITLTVHIPQEGNDDD